MRMSTNLLRLSATLFITGVFLEGLALLFQGLSISVPVYLGGRVFRPSPRSLALSTLYVLSGILQVVLATYLYSRLSRLTLLSSFGLGEGKASAIIVDSVLLLLYLAGLEELLKLNLSGSIGLLVSAAIFTLVLHPKLVREFDLGEDELVRQSLILSGSVLLAFGGFSSNSVIALTHVGLVSIPIFIYSITSLIRLVGATQMLKDVKVFSSLIIEVFLALAVMVGGSVNVSGIYLFGLNVMATFSGGLYLASGVLGIITGILLLIILMAIHAHEPILTLQEEASTKPPMQI